MTQPDHPVSSPWRQPIVWLVVLLVAAAVVGGVVMVRVAGQDGPMDAVPDEVSRTGQVQQADLGPDALAAERKLSAIVRVDAKAGEVEVIPVTGECARDEPLRLQLHHPLRAAEDTTLELAPTELGWRTEAMPARDHDW
ncbi:MAG TPA: FixH family protein, partial [Luteimonas sp.]